MMKLLYQSHSPYARKVLVAAHELGLAGELEVIHHETSPLLPNDAVSARNPLGKVPVLVLDDGLVLFDSDVICAWLDGRHGGSRLIPADVRRRWRALRLQALAQGVADAGIAVRWETDRRPPELRWGALRDGQLRKIAAACDLLEEELDDGDGDAPDIGAIAIATALSWIEFRRVYAFRAGGPRLAAWYARIDARPSMRATTLSGDTRDH
ncbi:MAG: glutathione S-transferase family protein [Dokdonella sp.]|uniref:glutathione S-transferase family protein n=1 Tax=Dokdonella sp. TaxID=2291710 RepID=UPI003F80CC82